MFLGNPWVEGDDARLDLVVESLNPIDLITKIVRWELA